MPYTAPQWVEPEEFVRHDFVTVYRTYKNDELEQGYQHYLFTTSLEAADDREDFDVRELARELGYSDKIELIDVEQMKKIIRHAIDCGMVKS